MRFRWNALTLGWALAACLGAGCARRVALVPWKAPGVSSPQFESHAAFDPWTGDLYFVRSSPAFEGWRILWSRCTAQGWAPPQPAPFAGDGVEADPFFADGGRTLYFISTRTTDGVKRSDLDIWRVVRTTDDRWGTPLRLPAPLNSTANEWFPRPSADGWLYFGSARAGGLGGNDIWRARPGDAAGDGWAVENLGPAVNGPGQEYEAEPSADGSRLVIATDQGLFETRRVAGGWSPRQRLGPEVGADASDVGPLLSPTGRSLLFSRDRGPAGSGEFLVWRQGEGDEPTWPPGCDVGSRETLLRITARATHRGVPPGGAGESRPTRSSTERTDSCVNGLGR